MEFEENVDYRPEPPMYYNFKGKQILSNTYKKQLQSYKKLSIIAYDVRTNGSVPFMQILLSKSITCEELIFPNVPLLSSINNSHDFINYVKVCLFGIIGGDDYENFDRVTHLDGFYESETNELYIFFEISKFKLQLDDIYLNSGLRFALIDELMHHKSVCNIPISKEVSKLFNISSSEYSYEFCFLIDDSGENYEIPVVAYTSKLNKKLNYSFVFGEIKGDKNELFGPYYYFKNFTNAFEYACEMISRIGSSGIVRYALILGSVKYIENSLDDSIDKSDIKQQRLQDEKLDQNFERQTMRISDHDGKWSQYYDSLYLGSIELDDGNKLRKDYCNMMVVKEYEQQIPLSFHYVNKNTLQGIDKNYKIK